MLTRRGLLYQFGAAGASILALRSGVAFAAIAPQTAVDFDVPPGACDCHVHVFDPKFPFAERRVYTPPPASVEDLLELQRALRLDRVVIVQPSVYGTDNACTLDATRRLGPRARAVVVIGKDTSKTELDNMSALGARGARLNLETTTTGPFDASAAKRVLDSAVEQLHGRNWHIQIYTRLSVLKELKNHLAQLPFPVVIDHFGRANAAEGPNQEGFDALLELLKSGRAYVKISAAYRMEKATGLYPDAAAIAQALVSANPDRVVWGSDWPHVNSAYGRGRPLTDIAPPIPIDNGLVLNQLPQWTKSPPLPFRLRPARVGEWIDDFLTLLGYAGGGL
jgi:predicted TIM-barrel fold metal-dependent hydrolase